MSNQTLTVFRKTFGRPSPFNILTFDTHERYQTQLAKTGHNFYSFRYPGCKTWDKNYAPLPPNYYAMPEGIIANGVGLDMILAQSKFGQFQVAKQIQQHFKIPIVSLEHTLPIPSWPNQQLEVFRSMKGDCDVFTSEYATKQWNMSGPNTVIHHSVDSNVFSPGEIERKPVVLSVVNDYINRDYCCNYQGWQRITTGLPVKLVGNTPGLSEAAPNVEALVKEYQSAQIFLNTSTISPIPTALLEAMSCGCAVVTTANCMVPEIIEQGVNGYISNDEGELRGYIEKLINNPDLCNLLGRNARQTIQTKFSEEQFIEKWNQVFHKTYNYGVTK